MRSLFLILAILSCQPADEAPDSRAIAFYYNWYDNPEQGEGYRHWNHEVLEEGGGQFSGGEDIGANFYPAHGCYSSHDPQTLRRHMAQMKRARIGTLCATWWGEGSFEDEGMDLLFSEAHRAGLKVCFHLEPFAGRNAETSRAALMNLQARYGEHPALWRDEQGRPLFFVYDSYLTPARDWARLLQPQGEISIRGTELDACMIGLWVQEDEKEFMAEAGFDGVYSYFATDGFTWGSTTENWPALQESAASAGLFFVPCVGPGYLDTRIRPWNARNQRDREGGHYYRRMFQAALSLEPPLIGITSFNEWHEGTQIEPARPMQIEGYRYEDYSPADPNAYLDASAELLSQYPKQ